VVYGLREFIVSGGETGLYVQSLSSPSKASAPLPYIKSLFVDEKLPFHLGWRPSPEPVTLLSLGGYILELFAANPDKFAEGAGKLPVSQFHHPRMFCFDTDLPASTY
jgi:hypothetical protein